MQCMYNVTFEVHSRNHCCSGKSVIHILSVYL